MKMLMGFIFIVLITSTFAYDIRDVLMTNTSFSFICLHQFDLIELHFSNKAHVIINSLQKDYIDDHMLFIKENRIGDGPSLAHIVNENRNSMNISGEIICKSSGKDNGYHAAEVIYNICREKLHEQNLSPILILTIILVSAIPTFIFTLAFTLLCTSRTYSGVH